MEIIIILAILAFLYFYLTDNKRMDREVKEISHIREIDEKYQLDDDILQLFMKTFYDFKELNKKESVPEYS